MLFEIGSLLLRPRNEIAVFTPYQKIEDLATILTRIRAIAERITAETTE
jgi:hypothetical protein